MNNENGTNLRINMQITLEEAFSGCVKSAEYSYYDKCKDCFCGNVYSETCPVCKGNGQIVRTKKTLFMNNSKICNCGNCNGAGKIIKTIGFQKKKMCKKCNGQGYTYYKNSFPVLIPAGIDTGQSIRIRNKGLYGVDVDDENRGDLLVVIYVTEHPVFRRNMNDLYFSTHITQQLAKNGGELMVEMIDGKIRLKINPNTLNNTTIKIKGKGMPTLRDKTVRGDCYLTIQY